MRYKLYVEFYLVFWAISVFLAGLVRPLRGQ